MNNAANCKIVKIMLSPGQEYDFEGFEKLKINTKSHKNRYHIEIKNVKEKYREHAILGRSGEHVMNICTNATPDMGSATAASKVSPRSPVYAPPMGERFISTSSGSSEGASEEESTKGGAEPSLESESQSTPAAMFVGGV